jgi:glycosyltransferase involved in cell wall biosynthesis
MQIYHLINTLAPGGAENLIHNLTAQSENSDISFSVGYLWGDDTLASKLRLNDVSVHDFNTVFRYNPFLIKRIAKSLMTENIDVLHAHLPVSQAVGRVAGRLAGVDTIVTTQHNVPNNYGIISGSLEKLTRQLDDATIAISHGVLEAWGQPDWNVIYNGIDVSRYRTQIESANPMTVRNMVGNPSLLLLNVSRYVPEKNHEDLIRMMLTVREAIPDSHLILVGWGNKQMQLRNLISKLDLTQHVTLTGRVESVYPFYSAADVFVSALNYQGMGIVHFEAMAASLPIVSTDIQDMREVVDNKVSGYLTQPRNPQALAEAVIRLESNNLRVKMGKAGLAKAREDFTIDRMAKEYIELYERLANN